MKNRLIIVRQFVGIAAYYFFEDKLSGVWIDKDKDADDDGYSVGDIYIGKVKNTDKNLKAAFVEIGEAQLGFLSVEAGVPPFCLLNRKFDGRVLAGDELVVQIEKSAVKSKVITLTTNLTISGKYAVVKVCNKDGEGRLNFSKKLRKSDINPILKDIENKLIQFDTEDKNIPCMGFIIRTNAGGVSSVGIINDMEFLENTMKRILLNAKTRTVFSKLYGAPCEYLNVIKNVYAYGEIVTDDDKIYNEIIEFLKVYQPEDLNKLTRYDDKQISLSALYGLSGELDRLLKKRVWLKSGAYLVIEPTEALTVIDVNSGRFNHKNNQYGGDLREEVFFEVNKEAAIEIARQIRLRNLSGIIIVDFINMKDSKHNKELLNLLRREFEKDNIKTSLEGMTHLGLVEITRRRMNVPLHEICK